MVEAALLGAEGLVVVRRVLVERGRRFLVRTSQPSMGAACRGAKGVRPCSNSPRSATAADPARVFAPWGSEAAVELRALEPLRPRAAAS